MSILNEDEEENRKREPESDSSEEEKGVNARNLKRRKVVPNKKSSGFFDDL